MDANYLINGRYSSKDNSCTNIQEESETEHILLSVSKIVYQDKATPTSVQFGLQTTKLESFRYQNDIVALISENVCFIEKYLENAIKLLPDIITNNYYGSFCCWTHEISDNNQVKYSAEPVSWMYEKEHSISFRVDRRFETLLLNNYEEIPSSLLIRNNDQIYLNFSTYIDNMKYSLIESRTNSEIKSMYKNLFI